MDSRPDTERHIQTVRRGLFLVVTELTRRAQAHDESKLRSPEVEIFDRFTSKLAKLKYSTPEYSACLKELGPALDHHYANNDHHPEFFGRHVCVQCGLDDRTDPCTCGGPRRPRVDDMNLWQIVEMLVDWKAAGLRHGGNLISSIEANQERFGYSDEFRQILLNSVPLIDEITQF